MALKQVKTDVEMGGGFSDSSGSTPIGPSPSENSIVETENDFTFKIGNQSFTMMVGLMNGMEEYPPFMLPSKFIEDLVIEEQLEDWNSKGYITINNSFELLERGCFGSFGGELLADIKEPYMVRTDGRNRLLIGIRPFFGENQPPNLNDWEISLNCVIYDIEDLETEAGNASTKLRRFYFWDERFQILRERNLEWSTSVNGPNRGQHAPDENRTMSISDAIKSVIKCASSNSLSDVVDPKGTGSASGNNNDSNIKIGGFDMASFSEEWDVGDEAESKVLYTSPANSFAIDDINYLLSLFKSSDGSPAILRLDRYSSSDSGKRFSLKSLKSIIEKAEDNQVERLVINDLVDPEMGASHFNRAPTETKNGKNFSSAIASVINNYKFSQMSPLDDLNFVNSPVHNFNFNQSEFSIQVKSNSLKTFLKNSKEILESGLYSLQGQESKAQVLLNATKTKLEGLNTKNVLVPQTFFPKDISFIRNFFQFILLTQAINFTINGLTVRSPGKFVYIDRPYSPEKNNAFDDRFLGQWLLVNVTHRFQKDSYSTDVVAVKPDIFTKYWEEEEDFY